MLPRYMIGSLITALLWAAAQWGYIYGVSNYRAYYGALAAIPIFLVWIYFSWAFVLPGVEFAVVLQRGPARPLKRFRQISHGASYCCC